MKNLDLDVGRGGRAANHGAIYLQFRSGSRATGVCAASAYDYIAREGRFDDQERDRAIYVESGHMPTWAEDDPHEYWDAADLYECANARLYVDGVFVLPCGLSVEDRIDLARTYIRELTDRERLPYTFAIHAGEDGDGHEHNPHVHLMLSERGLDGLERCPQDWFRRSNRQHPERGGARKSHSLHGRDWVEHARERLAAVINDRLRACGREERVDHRSYKRQGIDREPREHFGLAAIRVFERTGASGRLQDLLADEDAPRNLVDLDARIERLEQLRANLVLEQYALDHGEQYPVRSRTDGFSRDSSPER